MFGLSDKSKTQVAYEKKDKEKIIRYRIVTDLIDVGVLKHEKELLQAELTANKPTDEELKEAGKASFPFYTRNEKTIRGRINTIDSILGAR